MRTRNPRGVKRWTRIKRNRCRFWRLFIGLCHVEGSPGLCLFSLREAGSRIFASLFTCTSQPFRWMWMRFGDLCFGSIMCPHLVVVDSGKLWGGKIFWALWPPWKTRTSGLDFALMSECFETRRPAALFREAELAWSCWSTQDVRTLWWRVSSFAIAGGPKSERAPNWLLQSIPVSLPLGFKINLLVLTFALHFFKADVFKNEGAAGTFYSESWYSRLNTSKEQKSSADNGLIWAKQIGE